MTHHATERFSERFPSLTLEDEMNGAMRASNDLIRRIKQHLSSDMRNKSNEYYVSQNGVCFCTVPLKGSDNLVVTVLELREERAAEVYYSTLSPEVDMTVTESLQSHENYEPCKTTRMYLNIKRIFGCDPRDCDYSVELRNRITKFFKYLIRVLKGEELDSFHHKYQEVLSWTEPEDMITDLKLAFEKVQRSCAV